MKCLRKRGCSCKTCKREILYSMKVKSFVGRWTDEELTEMCKNMKGYKYPQTPKEKEMSNRKSFISGVFVEQVRL